MAKENLEELKRMNLIYFLEGLGFKPHWQSGERAMFLSPLREEGNPSFYVQRSSDGSWTWKDWGTGEYGDIIKFVQAYYRVDFKEALRRLRSSPEPLRSSVIEVRHGNQAPKTSEWAKEFYRKEIIKMKGQKSKIVQKYFLDNRVRYYSEMKCILARDRKEGKLYVGIPIPYPLKMRGLELREIGGNSKKTWGKKTLWLLSRDSPRILVTESIMDALAGEIILGDDKFTLCSLNGIGNVGQLADLVRVYKPLEVILALDGDEPGQNASLQARELLQTYGVLRVAEYREHIEAGVKDLHKLLLLRGEETFFDRYKKFELAQMCGVPAYLS